MKLVQRVAHLVAEAAGRESPIVRRVRPIYESVLGRLSLGRGVAWQMNGAEYRIDPAQRHRFAPRYDEPVARFLQERIRPGALCFNAGANVGVYVLQLARWSAPGGRVVAFEPNPSAAAVLDRHIGMNHLEDRIKVVRAAVGAKPGVAILHASGADGMSRLGSPNAAIAEHTGAIAVPLVTLDEFCEASGEDPDVIFMDIEGAELDALEGAARLLRRRGERLLLLAELHPALWSRPAGPVFEALSLRAVPLTGQRDPVHDYGIVQLAMR